eukprot:347439-Chlamydomonas_euryale.AAC.1
MASASEAEGAEGRARPPPLDDYFKSDNGAKKRGIISRVMHKFFYEPEFWRYGGAAAAGGAAAGGAAAWVSGLIGM